MQQKKTLRGNPSFSAIFGHRHYARNEIFCHNISCHETRKVFLGTTKEKTEMATTVSDKFDKLTVYYAV